MNDVQISLFVGSYAKVNQDSVFRYRFGSDGKLALVSSFSGIENPSFISPGADGECLFAVSESKTGNASSSASIDFNGVVPTLLTQVFYEGAGSCHLVTDRGQRHAFVANYIGGSLAVLPIINGSILLDPVQLLKFTGSGPNCERQEQSHVHSTIFSLNEQLLYLADLGADRIYGYHYHPQASEPIVPANPSYITLPGGSGPRHMAVHPTAGWLYVLCELSGDIFVFEPGMLSKWVHRYAVTAAGFTGEIAAGDVKIDQAGKFLYASNRGDANEILVFSIDVQTGALVFIQKVCSGGEGPRHLAIDPTGAYLLAANEKGNTVTEFEISTEDGTLHALGIIAEINAPTCLQFIVNSR